MAVMSGFPPEEVDQATLANWRTSPYNAWAFHHVREIVPSADIPNAPDDVWAIPKAEPRLPLARLAKAIAASPADAVVVFHDGELIFEDYRNGMNASSPHILMSVSKSMLGLLGGALVGSGELDVDALVTDYVPEVAPTIYQGATVRNLLDMRVSSAFDEDYTATSGAIIDYRYAANWNPVPEGVEPGDLRSFMQKMTERDAGGHGEAFHYVSPNTDLLVWVYERASGMRYADLFSERLWKPMGAESSAYVTVDRIGGARGAGGVNMTARDLARVGQLMIQGGARDGRQVIPESWIRDIEENGDKSAWEAGNFAEKFGALDMHYRSKWYVHRGDKPLVHGLGIHGQYLFVDRARNLSVAWFSSGAEPLSDTYTPAVLAEINALREAIDAL
ncbi:MAG: serine hydrolase [Pseudomonadota bacterium]